MTSRRYTGWRTSSRSDGGDNCVEVARADDGMVGVRDSKHRTGPILEFDPGTWRRLIDAIRAGMFDRHLGHVHDTRAVCGSAIECGTLLRHAATPARPA